MPPICGRPRANGGEAKSAKPKGSKTGSGKRNRGKARGPKKNAAQHEHNASLEELLTFVTRSNGSRKRQPSVKQPLERCERLVAEMHARTLEIAILLAIVHRDRLYKSRGYRSIRDYAEQHLEIQRPDFYHFTSAVGVLLDLYNRTNSLILPANEYQCRVLAPLTKQERIDVWMRVLAATRGAKITAKIISQHISAYMLKKVIQEPDEPSIIQERSPQAENGGGRHESCDIVCGEADPSGEDTERIGLENAGIAAETPHVGDMDVNDTEDIEVTDSHARLGSPTALIRRVMADGRPHPTPSLWDLPPKSLKAAYVFQPLSPEQQRKRLWAAKRAGNQREWIRLGKEAVENAFATLARTPLMEPCGKGTRRATELWLASADANGATV